MAKKEKSRKKKVTMICPRCGRRVSWIERTVKGDKEYFYAVHYLGREGGKKKVEKCYLGPALYDYVTRTNPLSLMGALADLSGKPVRVLDYIYELLNRVEAVASELEEGEALALARRLREVADRIEARVRAPDEGDLL